MTFEVIQYWVWQIGGCLFSILIILGLLTYLFSKIIEFWIGWSRGSKDNIFYWIKHKKRLNEIIEKELLSEGKGEKP